MSNRLFGKKFYEVAVLTVIAASIIFGLLWMVVEVTLPAMGYK